MSLRRRVLVTGRQNGSLHARQIRLWTTWSHHNKGWLVQKRRSSVFRKTIVLGGDRLFEVAGLEGQGGGRTGRPGGGSRRRSGRGARQAQKEEKEGGNDLAVVVRHGRR